MDRRSFLRTLAGGTAAAVAVRSWPFRSYFFPAKPIVQPNDFLVLQAYPYRFRPGQLVGVYGSGGGLERGAFRIVSVNAATCEIRLDRVMSQFKIDLSKLTEGIEEQDLLLRDVAAPAASWKRKLLRA